MKKLLLLTITLLSLSVFAGEEIATCQFAENATDAIVTIEFTEAFNGDEDRIDVWVDDHQWVVFYGKTGKLIKKNNVNSFYVKDQKELFYIYENHGYLKINKRKGTGKLYHKSAPSGFDPRGYTIRTKKLYNCEF